MIVLDASVLIGLLRVEEALHQRAERLFHHYIDQEFAFHAVTHAEILVGPSKNGTAALVTARLLSLEIRTIPLHQSEVLPLADTRVRTGLKLPAACVLLVAVTLGASIAAFDERLRRAAVEVGGHSARRAMTRSRCWTAALESLGRMGGSASAGRSSFPARWSQCG